MRRSLFCLCLVVMMGVVLAPQRSHAQSYQSSTFYTFCSGSCSNQVFPDSDLIEGSDGNFYGTSYEGGANDGGTVFKLTPSGELTIVYSFCSQFNCSDGFDPVSVTQGTDGNLYGTTFGSASYFEPTDEVGTVFKLTPQGVLTTLYTFCSLANCADGALPGPIIQGSDGNFYGAAEGGGIQNQTCDPLGCGTIFKITPSGELTILYSFCSLANCAEGFDSYFTFVQGADGSFYATNRQAGQYSSNCPYFGCGTIFKVSSSGSFTTLYSFCSVAQCADGYGPIGPLVVGENGSVYGITQGGGAGTNCIYAGGSNQGCGTFFSITPDGQFTTLNSNFEGYEPASGPYLASDGNFYVPTVDATLLELSPAGSLITPQILGGGSFPVIQGNDGNFFETGGNILTETTVSPALSAPVKLTFSASSVGANSPVTLTWQVLNAYSLTMQQCTASVLNNPAGAGTWTGLQTGTMTNGIYSGSATITPTAAGFYTYGLNCGGAESGVAYLSVSGARLPTTTSVASNTPVTINSSAMLTSSVVAANQFVGTPTGSVTFSTGSLTLATVPLTNGTASLDVSATGVAIGTYPITASYSGDANYQPSSSTTAVVVQGYATATNMTTNLGFGQNAVQGRPVTFNVVVNRAKVSGTPTGKINFYNFSLFLGSTPVLQDGTATFTAAPNGDLNPGTYFVTAQYEGDASDQPSTSEPVQIYLDAATTTTLTATPDPIPANSFATLTAKVKQTYDAGIPTGTVTFSVGSYNLGSATLDNTGTATVNASDVGIAAGTYPVTATYSGDSGDGASTSAAVNVTVQ